MPTWQKMVVLKVNTFPIYLAVISLSDVVEKILEKNKENL